MRGVETTKSGLRSRVFIEIAGLAYEGWDEKRFHDLPYKIVNGGGAGVRDDVYVQREIAAERLRAAMGLSLRQHNDTESPLYGVDAEAVEDKYYSGPLVDIIRFACNRCHEKRLFITDGCQGCLEHPCTEVCPKKAISIVYGRYCIDESSCVKCGLCREACSYNAIILQERPCAAACGMNAIRSDELGRAEIDYDKCVSCGRCIVNCPFGAVVDKSQLYQTITAIKSGVPVYAVVSPAISGQFGSASFGQLRAAFLELGFADVHEAAGGADLCTFAEAREFLEDVPARQPFMAASCCPAWSAMVKKQYPEYADCVSMELTPMVLTARLIKSRHPGSRVCFIGPCTAKKLEASRSTIRPHVDFVLTFEELAAMFEARGTVVSELPDMPFTHEASGDGVGYAVGGGAAKAIQKIILQTEGMDINIAAAEGLQDCRKLLSMAKAGRYNSYLLEGMACPGGCVGGSGVIAPAGKAAAAVRKEASGRTEDSALFSEFLDMLPELEKEAGIDN